jgi:alkanesulfonate monooxygenase SsuD/methylene tetrahydromethanopterin reductase-like flavin-dependent oxidoreductase (luciferase family)
VTSDRTAVSFGLAQDVELATLADELGYDVLFAPEGQGRSVFPRLTRLAEHTRQIGLATGIVNIFSRSPSTIAQEVATLDEFSDGRAILGLGVAHPDVVETFHGMDFDRPLARMEEYIELVRRYLSGNSSAYVGEFYSPGRTSFWDTFEPTRPSVPIYNAAIGPKNVRLTGSVADGWLPHLFPLDRLERGLEWLEDGAARADRDAGDIDVVMYLVVSVDEDVEQAKKAAAKHVATYMRDIPGYYTRVAKNSGFEEDVQAAQSAESLDSAADQLSEEYLNKIAIFGTEDTVRDRVASFRDAGVDMPVIRPPNSASRPQIETTLDLFGSGA